MLFFFVTNSKVMFTVLYEIFNCKIAKYQTLQISSLMFLFPGIYIPVRLIPFNTQFPSLSGWHLSIQRTKATKTSLTPKISLSNIFLPNIHEKHLLWQNQAINKVLGMGEFLGRPLPTKGKNRISNVLHF